MFELNKQIADKIMTAKGDVRGVVFKTDEKFILTKGGEEKLKEIEKEIKHLGYSINYADISTMSFYPIGLRVLSLMAIAKVFKMNKKDVEEMGSFAPKTSLIIKFFMQYFLSVKKTLAQVSKMWKKHYTNGEMTSVEIEEKDGRAIVKLEGLDVHPIFCSYLLGYFLKIIEMVVKKPARGEEIECVFNGDKAHIFSLKW